tara:strand:+ start:1626 stop:2243 length:618 start_codon:yes stop_codon:yes gene_type:complete
MSIIATSSGSSQGFDPIEAGSYAARCYSMVQLGTNEEIILGVTKELHKVRITWELPTEMKVFKEENGEQPMVISKEFTLSMHEKANLRQFLETWRGKSFTEDEAKSFDITALLGKPCLLSISHKVAKNNNTYANISGVNLLPKGMECPPQINDTFELSFDNWDETKFASLPDFIKSKIVTSREYKAMIEPRTTNDTTTTDDDIPF